MLPTLDDLRPTTKLGRELVIIILHYGSPSIAIAAYEVGCETIDFKTILGPKARAKAAVR